MDRALKDGGSRREDPPGAGRSGRASPGGERGLRRVASFPDQPAPTGTTNMTTNY